MMPSLARDSNTMGSGSPALPRMYMLWTGVYIELLFVLSDEVAHVSGLRHELNDQVEEVAMMIGGGRFPQMEQPSQVTTRS
jgi:hypothetical protein